MAVEPEDYAETSARLHDLMIRQLGAKGEDFPATFRHSGRLLPRKPRQAAQRIIETGAQIENPKLARVTDHTGLAEDAALVERHLTRLNPQARRARAGQFRRRRGVSAGRDHRAGHCRAALARSGLIRNRQGGREARRSSASPLNAAVAGKSHS